MALDWRFWPVIQDFLERPRGQLLGTHVVREADDSHTRKRGILETLQVIHRQPSFDPDPAPETAFLEQPRFS